MTTVITPPIHDEVANAENDWRNLPDDRRYEMVDGELVELPPMRRGISIVTGKVYRLFIQHIEEENLPFWVGIAASFRLGLSSANFRIPDLCVAAERPGTPSIEDEPGVWEGAPDIAVEVVSPTDAYVEVIDKARLYLRQGVSTVLLVDAYSREVTVRQSTGEITFSPQTTYSPGSRFCPGFHAPWLKFSPAWIARPHCEERTSSHAGKLERDDAHPGLYGSLGSAGRLPSSTRKRRPRCARVSWVSRRSPGTAKSASRIAPAAWCASATARPSACPPA